MHPETVSQALLRSFGSTRGLILEPNPFARRGVSRCSCLCARALCAVLTGQSDQAQNGFGGWIRFHQKVVVSLSCGCAAPVQGRSAAVSLGLCMARAASQPPGLGVELILQQVAAYRWRSLPSDGRSLLVAMLRRPFEKTSLTGFRPSLSFQNDHVWAHIS